MKVYRTAKGYRIFVGVVATPLMLFLLYLLFTILLGDTSHKLATGALAAVLILPITVLAIALYEVFMGKVIVGENSLYVKGVVSRELAFDDIKGFRKMQQYIFIEPHSKQHKRMRIHGLLERQDEFAAWLTGHYPDLDIFAVQEERNEILDSDKFGSNIEERIENVQQFKRITRLLNRGAMVIALCTFLWRSPYFYGLCMAVFIISLIVYKRNDNVIKFDPKLESPYPSISPAILVPAFTLFFLGLLLDYEILSYRPLWIPLFVLTAISAGVFFRRNREFNFDNKVLGSLNILGISMIFMMFIYGSMNMINYQFDTSQPKIYQVKVLKKNGACTSLAVTCPIIISAWEKQPEQEISIKSELYHTLNENDDVAIHLKAGALGVSWFEIVPIREVKD